MSATSSKKRGTADRAKGGGSSSARSKVSGRAPKRAAEFLERLLPESGEQSGEAFADRQTRRKTAHKMERTYDRAIETFDRIEEELDADEESIEQREWDDRDERRRSDEHAREREEDRKDVWLALETKERLKALVHRDVLLGLTVLTTLAAIVLAYLAVRHKQVGYAGASAFTTALSASFFRRIRWPAAAAAPAASVNPDPQPYRWSVLDLPPRPDQREQAGRDR